MQFSPLVRLLQSLWHFLFRLFLVSLFYKKGWFYRMVVLGIGHRGPLDVRVRDDKSRSVFESQFLDLQDIWTG